MNDFNLLFSLLGDAIEAKSATKEIKMGTAEQKLATLYKVAKSHDLAHLVAEALDKNGLLDDSDIAKKFRGERNMAIFRYEQINYELGEICRVFEENKIEHIPLKGSVLRAYYPQPWMRTSCDIDILIQEENLDKAIKLLCENLGYGKVHRGTHDVSIYSPSNVNLELHFSLLEDNRANNASVILDSVWQHLQSDGNGYRKTLQDDFFYYYHVAHMAKHIEFGGCGIKPFLDLWVLNERVPFDQEKRDAILVEGGLKTLADTAKKLAYVWFGEETHTPLTQKLEEYILTGGVYGSAQNMVAAQAAKKGKGLKYILSRIWFPYDLLKLRYPRVEKCKLLIPYYQVCRWMNFLFKGKKKTALAEARETCKSSDEKTKNIQAMLQELGLQ